MAFFLVSLYMDIRVPRSIQIANSENMLPNISVYISNILESIPNIKPIMNILTGFSIFVFNHNHPTFFFYSTDFRESIISIFLNVLFISNWTSKENRIVMRADKM